MTLVQHHEVELEHKRLHCTFFRPTLRNCESWLTKFDTDVKVVEAFKSALDLLAV